MPATTCDESDRQGECSALIHIWTEAPIRESDPHTALRIDGHPRFTRLLVPNDQLKGWDGYHLDIQGTEVGDLQEGAPWWQFDLQDGPLTIELRAVGAAKTPAPMMALIRWEPGAEVSPSIQVTSADWVDGDLLAAG